MTIHQETPDELTRVAKVSSQFQAGLLGLPVTTVSLSWAIETLHKETAQLAYRIQVSNFTDFSVIAGDSGWVEDREQINLPAPGSPFSSREVRHYRVQIRTTFGTTNWSESTSVEAGLLAPQDHKAKFIATGAARESASPLLRKVVTLPSKPARARLYATSMGLNEVFINGQRVGDSFLNPGWTAYQERLTVDTFDVTHLLAEGANSLCGILSDGWWRGRFGFTGHADHYGTAIALFCQLEVDFEDGSSATFVTDESWKYSTGEFVFNSIYDGSEIDFLKGHQGWLEAAFSDSDWQPVEIVAFDSSHLKPRTANPVRIVDEFNMTIQTKDDRTLLRGTQNISGWVRLTVDGRKGQKVTVRHAEVLEPGDALHVKALRSARATDIYTLGFDGRHVLEPKFTFHGFQYADVVTDAEVISAVAVAISSDNERRGEITTSDTRINRLVENVVWSQLDNFVSVPTDCPQRDERLGWTGDAQAFAAASNTLFDTQNFWKSWLIDLEIDQFENGDVGAVVPDLLKRTPNLDIQGWILEGRAGWADAATIVPMSIYEYFGDKDVLRVQLNSMRRWTNALDARRAGKALLPSEFQFGDWCDPDAPGDRPWESKVSADFVANSFFAHTAELMAMAEKLVGDPSQAAHYEQMAEALKEDVWNALGAEARKTTAGCAIALEFDIAPKDERRKIADELASMVKSDQGKITTGFLGTPLILHALSKNGHVDAAYTMLMRRSFRSWLYAVDKGATTMWERWDAIREDGSIHSGAMETNPEGQDDSSMISFNHYAYGAVADWIFRNLGGLAPKVEDPGYRSVDVAPLPAVGFAFANTKLRTSFGEIQLKWQITESGLFVADLEIPFGVTANLSLPVSGKSISRINGTEVGSELQLKYGSYRAVVTNPALVDYLT